MDFRCLGLKIRSLIGWQEPGGTDVARFARLCGVIAQFALKQNGKKRFRCHGDVNVGDFLSVLSQTLRRPLLHLFA